MQVETITRLPVAPGSFCSLLGRLLVQYDEEYGPQSSEVQQVLAEMREFGCPVEVVGIPGKGEPEPAVEANFTSARCAAEMYITVVRNPTVA